MKKGSMKICKKILMAIIILLPQVAHAEFSLKFLKCEQLTDGLAHIYWEMDNKTDTYFKYARFSLDILDIDNVFIQQPNSVSEMNLRPGKKARGVLSYFGECVEIATIEVSGTDGFQADEGYIYHFGWYNQQYAINFRRWFDRVISTSAYGNVKAIWVSR